MRLADIINAFHANRAFDAARFVYQFFPIEVATVLITGSAENALNTAPRFTVAHSGFLSGKSVK